MSWQPPETDEWFPPDTDEIVGQQSQEQAQASGSFPETRAIALSGESPVMKAWQMLNVPSQMAQRGLQSMAEGLKPEPEITGNLVRDVAMNYPSFSADVLSKAVPGFVSRASLLTAGGAKALQALRPVGSVVGQGVAGQLESATGSNPGSLARAWNDPTLILAQGKKAAGPLYEAGKTGGEMAANLKNIPTKEQFLEVASKLADEGKLPPETALEGRKIAGKLLSKGGGKYTEDFLRGLVGKFDAIAKSSKDISAGDAAYRRGLDAASLRKLLPQNKYGGTSAFKTGIMSVLGPSWAGLLSPAVHGAVSTLGGLTARVVTSPAAAVTARQALITQFIENRSQGSQ